MNNVVTVAGATGQLEQRVALALARRGASVRALVRGTSSHRAHEVLRRAGADVRTVSFGHGPGLAETVRGSSWTSVRDLLQHKSSTQAKA